MYDGPGNKRLKRTLRTIVRRVASAMYDGPGNKRLGGNMFSAALGEWAMAEKWCFPPRPGIGNR
jgi:hypothetical protein